MAKTHADNVPEKTTTVTVKIEKPELEVTKTSDKKVYSFEDTAHYTVRLVIRTAKTLQTSVRSSAKELVTQSRLREI